MVPEIRIITVLGVRERYHPVGNNQTRFPRSFPKLLYCLLYYSSQLRRPLIGHFFIPTKTEFEPVPNGATLQL